MVAGVSKLAKLPVQLPSISIPEETDPKVVAAKFGDILSRIRQPTIFTNDAVWRDVFALTSTLRTFYSAEGIVQAWDNTTRVSAEAVIDSLVINHGAAMLMQLPNGCSWVEVSGSFKIKTAGGLIGKCSLMMGVIPQGDDWKIWTLRTVLDDIEQYPSVNQYSPPMANGTASSATQEYVDVVIVGGGQAGLSVAGRLQALGVKYIVIDRYKEIGDSWRTRYDSARLHTTREYSHLPFDRTFPGEDYQEFLTKDDLARGYEAWTRKFGIDTHVWTQCELLSGTWDDETWTLKLRKAGQDAKVKCRFVVMASGAGGQIPKYESLPGRELFPGTMLHSQQYKSSHAWAGKQGIVIGTANTAHDIADDMVQAGMSTTMVQRSETYVLPYEYWQKISDRTYNKDFPTELADKLQMTGPNAVGRLVVLSRLHAMAASEPERFEALRKAGFLVDSQGDIMYHLLERGGGHYMDVGTSKKIADGKIMMKSDALPTRYTEEGLQFNDGTVIPADVIVWATGFEVNMRDSIRRLFGDEVADKIDDYFGIDDEGEVRGAWRIQHPGLITHGIALGQARFFSKYIALQIKAAMDERPFMPYTNTPIPPRHA